MNIGQLNIDELDQHYYAVLQLRHQPQGVLHVCVLRPDKVTQTMRKCSMGHNHKSAIILLGDTPGDQAVGWQFPENIFVVAVIGTAHEKDGKWECRPL